MHFRSSQTFFYVYDLHVGPAKLVATLIDVMNHRVEPHIISLQVIPSYLFQPVLIQGLTSQEILNVYFARPFAFD